MRNPSRLLASILCAALLGGLIPPEAAAQVAPVRISVSGSAGAGASAASVNAPLSLNSAPLSMNLAPAAGLSAAYAPAASVSASPLSAAAPSAVSPVAAPALAAAGSPIAAAAEGPSNEAPKAPKAAAPAAAKTSWLSRAASIFRRSSKADASAPAAAHDAAADKAAADRQFDGAAQKSGAETAPVAVPQASGKKPFFLARWAAKRVEAYKAKRAVEHDGFGGPNAEHKTFIGRVGYGFKWGLNLVGISALIDWVFTPLVSHVAWPLWLSPTAMHGLGRVELLVKYGPAQIGAALQHAAAPFLGIALPLSTFMEEFHYRFLSFGLAFGLLALAKPAAKLLAKVLDQIPDASGFRSKIQKLALNAGGFVTFFAFPAAALYSSFGFAAAHFAKWGVDPSIFALNLIAGYVLARMAYKTRGLTAPFVAHLVFNAAMLGGGILGVTFGLPLAGMIYPVLISIIGLGALWYNWRSHRKAFKFKVSTLAAGAKTLIIAGLISASVLGGISANRGSFDTAGFHANPAAITIKTPKAATQDTTITKDPVTDAKTAPADTAATAPAAAAPAESQADMIARVKPTVVQIIVKMDEGTAIGSGVIVTPNGKIVTNAHVVGPKQVGQLVIVELIDGTKVPAKILAVNHDRDQAILQLPRLMNKETRQPVAWPYSVFAKTAPREGDEVFAMGHPLGLPFTVTKGIVSGLGERSNMYVQYLQTDASINHGNSGGPLYNRAGEIIGINTMGVDESHNVGFSIIAPSVVRGLVQFAEVGNINTAALGVIVDLSNPDQPDAGVAVEFVRPGSAAAKAGLQPGDVIVGAAGEKIEEAGRKAVHDLSAILAQARPGDTIEVAVVRGDKIAVIKVKLDAKKTSEETSGAHGFDGESQQP